MRTIRFRGRKIDRKEWVYGELHISTTTHPHIHVDERRVLIDPNTVGQFTGLHDKNGNEIYEGDIVKRKCVNDGWPTNEGNWPVVFKNGSFGIEVGDGTHIRFAEKEVWADMSASGENIYEYEIIGNIYDNPELLKED